MNQNNIMNSKLADATNVHIKIEFVSNVNEMKQKFMELKDITQSIEYTLTLVHLATGVATVAHRTMPASAL